ncbi:uncharacterized protein LOC109204801 isoform X4 [Oreochromis niloticus]|uniref:uncharacterized protein LOC109204801 isoform X4 n=1 Tax=Oreochromis niloticus TaxID=8128 RepID=UPI000DF35EC3|nr:uncharacterized protein LOC109204801 isoform X4 [Oreochromis niloticus]
MDTIFGVALTYVVENIFPQVASYIAKKALQRYTSAQASAQTEKNVRSNDDDEVTYESHGPSSIGFHSCSEMAQEKPEHRRKDSAISELKLSPCAPPRLTVRSIYALNKREWLNIEFLGSEKTKPFDSMGQARMASIYWAQEKTVTVVSTSRTTTDDDFSVYWSHERSTIIYSTARRGTVSNDMLPCLTDKPYDHVTSHLSEIQSTSVTHTLKLASESFKDEPEEKSETQPDSSNTGYWSMNDMAWENVENIFPHIASYIAEKALQQYTSAQASAQTEKNVRSNDDDEVTYESHGPSSIGLRSCSEMVQEKPEHRRKDSAISELRLSPCAPPRLTVRSIYALNKREWLNIEFLGSEKTKPFDSMGQARMASIYWAQEKTVTVVSTSRTTTDDDFSVYWSHERSTIIYSTARRGTVSNDMLPCLTDKPYDHVTSHLSEIQSTSVTHTLKLASESFKDEPEEKSETQPDSSNTGYWSMNDMAWENVENIFPHIASYIAEKALQRYTSAQASAQTEKNVRSDDDDEVTYESHGPSSIGLRSCSEMVQEKPEHRRKDSAISELRLSPCAPPRLTVRSIYALNKREWLNIEFLGSEKTKPFDSMGQARMASIYWAQEKTVTVVSASRTTTDDDFSVYWSHERSTIIYSTARRGTVSNDMLPCLTDKPYDHGTSHLSEIQSTSVTHTLKPASESFKDELEEKSEPQPDSSYTGYWSMNDMAWENVEIPETQNGFIYSTPHSIGAGFQAARRRAEAAITWLGTTITAPIMIVIYMFYMLYQVFKNIAAPFVRTFYWARDRILVIFQEARRKFQMQQQNEAATMCAPLRFTVAAFTVIFMFYMFYPLFETPAGPFQTTACWASDWVLAVFQEARRKILLGQQIGTATLWPTLKITIAAFTVIIMFHILYQLFVNIAAAFQTTVYWATNRILAISQEARRKNLMRQYTGTATHWATLQITVAAFTVIFMFHMLYQLFVSIAAAFRTIVYWPIDWILAVIQAARRKIQIGQLIEAATTWATLRITVAAYTVIFMFHMLYQLFEKVTAETFY